MKTVLYCFSGTGNSLWVALDLAEKLGCELVSMTNAMRGTMDTSSQRVGVVFPTYMYRPPHLVVDFLQKLPPTDYLFAVATNGGDAGTSGDGTDTEDFINALKAANFGGFNDWRMLTVQELSSLVYWGLSTPAVNLEYFPNVQASYYWSSST